MAAERFFSFMHYICKEIVGKKVIVLRFWKLKNLLVYERETYWNFWKKERGKEFLD